MSMREDIENMKKEVKEVQTKSEERSWAIEILHDYKKQNKRLFILLILVISLWFITGAYLVYTLEDIGVETTTTTETSTVDIDDVDTIQNSQIHN